MTAVWLLTMQASFPLTLRVGRSNEFDFAIRYTHINRVMTTVDVIPYVTSLHERRFP